MERYPALLRGIGGDVGCFPCLLDGCYGISKSAVVGVSGRAGQVDHVRQVIRSPRRAFVEVPTVEHLPEEADSRRRCRSKSAPITWLGGEVQGLQVRTRCLHGTLRREFLNYVAPFVSVADAQEGINAEEPCRAQPA